MATEYVATTGFVTRLGGKVYRVKKGQVCTAEEIAPLLATKRRRLFREKTAATSTIARPAKAAAPKAKTAKAKTANKAPAAKRTRAKAPAPKPTPAPAPEPIPDPEPEGEPHEPVLEADPAPDE
jgi:hypothetical protein